MKKILSTTLFLCVLTLSNVVFSQVAIGTTTIENGVQFKVESTNSGVLIPRIALTARNVVAPVSATPPTGTLVFNTSTSGTFPYNVVPGFYYWDGIEWRAIADTKINKTVKFRNNSTTTNFSTSGGVYVDIFNTVDWNEETTLFQKINNTDLRITETGLYEVTCNLSLDCSSIERYLNLRLNINGVDTGENIRGLAPEDSGSNGTFSVHFTQYMVINANDVLRLRSYRDGSSATITFDALGTSSIVIKRIR
ncbi:MAG: hypothetical protein ACH34V_02465 [Flavobacterium sp.]|uniref:hypothetical protein n=1 Tax=Flavobacterium sp. TaxID=239 RepID=UPI0011D46DA3|nr:MAG: hypothetical protein E6Q46_03130 [Flavobacterium sp.]